MSDSMFGNGANLTKTSVTAEETKTLLEGNQVVSAVNAGHLPTLEAARSRYGLVFEVPEKAPNVSLVAGDNLLIMSVRGLPRLQDRHEYTTEEIQSASFVFSLWSVE